MAETRLQFFPNAGLIGIEFPGMEVDNYPFAVIFLKFAESPVGIREREYPQVAPTCTGEILSQKAYAGRRKFKQRKAVLQLMRVRKASRARNPIEVVVDRIDAGVVCKSLFSEDV
jgi:hypothetical protein